MKYLNDDISFDIPANDWNATADKETNKLYAKETGTYIFRLLLGNETIYTGNVFIKVDRTATNADVARYIVSGFNIYINNLLEDYAYVNEKLKPNSQGYPIASEFLDYGGRRFTVTENATITTSLSIVFSKIDNGDKMETATTTFDFGEDIFLAYKYPHKLKRLNKNRSINTYTQTGLMPVYPHKNTEKYGVSFCSGTGFGGTIEKEPSVKTYSITGVQATLAPLDTDTAARTHNQFNVYIPLSRLVSATVVKDIAFTYNQTLTQERKEKIGEFLYCDCGYFLQWQDRYGSLQSQHFHGVSKFSNEYEPDYITDYKGAKRLIHNSILSTFDINSGWIDDNVMPNYESIFSSPYLYLYDVAEDEGYFVVLEDKNFEEKTFFNNGRRLFNINIKLKPVKKQIINL